MQKKNYARFISRRSIVSLIGIDYDTLEDSGHDNYLKFILSGFLIILILVLSFASVFYAFDLMFNMWHAEILLSLFFGLTFFNIYIFLIQTFSKEVFPSSVRFKFFNLSNLSRIAFVLFIGFLIAQPIKVFFVRHQLDAQIFIYKEHLIEKFNKKNKAVYKADLEKLYEARAHFKLLAANETVVYQLKEIEKEVHKINERIKAANINAAVIISDSNFLTKRITYANQYKISNLIEWLIVIVFFAPVALIYSISGESKYYSLKKERDRKIVVDHYRSFKKHYQFVFENKYSKEGLSFYEAFDDPPFNTIRKAGPRYEKQEDFFLKYL